VIDLHNHLLWDIDDGSSTAEDAAAHLHAAEKCGLVAVVCTPHLFHPQFPEVSPALIRQRLDECRCLLPEQSSLRLFSGAEYYFGEELLRVIEQGEDMVSINDRKYVLLEFGPFFTMNGADHLVRALRSRGHTPLIAHPERHSYMNGHSNTVSRLMDQGCNFLMNSKSLTGRYGRQIQETAKRLLQMGYIHAIASDAHSARGLSSHYPESFAWTEETWGRQAAELLFLINPWLILHGLPTVPFFDEFALKETLKTYGGAPS
jgi:protein-tyrosine phosphatase